MGEGVSGWEQEGGMVKMERGSGVAEPPPSGVHPIHI